MQKDKSYYDNFFKKHGADVHNQPERLIKIAELCRGRVIDLGCGTGHLADYYKGAYVGIDISEEAVNIAKQLRRKDALFQVVDLTKTKLEVKKSVDTIVIGEFLEHINGDDLIFESIKEILAPDGIIIVSVPNGDRVPDESHCRFFTCPEIRRQYSKYGKVTFRKWGGFSARIIFTIEPEKTASNLLSLVMIVKNEAKGLERAILSVIDLVDSVTISVDNNSEDDTEKIARLYADNLRKHKWQDDFSAARNEAHSQETSKYILFLDGHEFVENYGEIKSKLLTDIDGIFVKVRMESGFGFMYPRIYKNGLRFNRAVHNLVDCKTKLLEPKFLIIHDRIGGQSEKSFEIRNKQRERMLPVAMKNQLKEDKNNLRALMHLGNYYMMRKEWKLAIKYYKRYIKNARHPEELYIVVLNKGNCEIMLGRHICALWTFAKAEKILPGRWETARMVGGLYMAKGRYKKALAWLVQALGGNTKHHLYHPFQHDISELWDLIAHCFNKQGQNAKAVVAWERAAEQTDDEKRKSFFKMKARYAQMLCQNFVQRGSGSTTEGVPKRGAEERAGKK